MRGPWHHRGCAHMDGFRRRGLTMADTPKSAILADQHAGDPAQMTAVVRRAHDNSLLGSAGCRTTKGKQKPVHCQRLQHVLIQSAGLVRRREVLMRQLRRK